MHGELLVFPTAGSESAESDSTELATRIEKCCFREKRLQGTYWRQFEATDGSELGLSWAGVLHFAISSKDQLKAIAKALLTAFAGKEVNIDVKSKGKQIAIRTRNADLTDVMKLLESVLDASG
jgi:hypothetical protein